MVVLVVDDTELSWSNSVDFLLCLQMPGAIWILNKYAFMELRSVTDLECDGRALDRFSNKMHVVHLDMILIDLLGFIAMRDKENIAFQVLLHDKPRAATKSSPFLCPIV